jgi:ribosomal protein L2
MSMKKYDYAERHGYVKGVVKDIVHDSGRGAPVAQIQFKDSYNFKRINTLMCAPEGMYSGQFVFAGKKGKSDSQLRILIAFQCLTHNLLPSLHIHSHPCHRKHPARVPDPRRYCYLQH